MRDIQPIPGLGPITTLRTHTPAPAPRPPSWEKYPALEVPPTPEAVHTPGPGPIYDIWLRVGIYFMLIWPWILFGVVWVKKGIQMNNRAAKVLEENPHDAAYFIKVISSIISIVVTAFFSLAIIRLYRRHLEALGHRLWGKSWTDIKYLSGHTHGRTSSASCESFSNMEDIQPDLGLITTLRPHTLPPGPQPGPFSWDENPAFEATLTPDIGLLAVFSTMLIISGVAWVNGMCKRAAEIVKETSRATAYFITVISISSIIAIVVTILYSFSIILFAQELVTYRRPTC